MKRGRGRQGCQRVQRSPQTWLDWEVLAINHADRALYDLTRIEFPFDDNVLGIFSAGLLGYRRYRRVYPDAYDAGVLARIVMDDRGTLMTRVWEVVAARGPGWSSAKDVAAHFAKQHTILNNPVDVRYYLNALVRSGDLEMCETYTYKRRRRGRQIVRWHTYRRRLHHA